MALQSINDRTEKLVDDNARPGLLAGEDFKTYHDFIASFAKTISLKGRRNLNR